MERVMRTVVAFEGLAVALGISVGMASNAYAQGAPPSRAPAAPGAQAPAPAPAQPASAGVLGPGQPAPPGTPGPVAVPDRAPATMDEVTPVAVPSDLVQAHPGGLTADQAGIRTSTTSWNAKASEETLRSAEAKVDTAWVAFLPRLSGRAEYERLSEFTPPKIALV